MQSLLEIGLRPEVQILVLRSFRALAILFIAWPAAALVRRLVVGGGAALMRREAAGDRGEVEERNKRVSTLITTAAKGMSVLIWCVAVVMALREAGFDIIPLLAGAGVVGLAIGFGAQNLVRDVIGGAFMLLENQIRVGDVAMLNGTGGTVQEINLRTTVLRDFHGVVHVFTNGGVTTLSNFTQQFSNYVFEIGIAYKEDPDRVVELLKQIGADILEEADWKDAILAPLEVLGVDRFEDSAVIIKMRIRTEAGRQWEVGREMNLRIKKAFDRAGVEIPFPHRTVYFGGDAHDPRASAPNADTLRQIIREELAALTAAGTDADLVSEPGRDE